MAVTAADVARYLGREDDPSVLSLAGEHVRVVTTFVRAYVRRNGFNEAGAPNEDLADVIVSATARLVVNPEQAKRVQVDDFSQTFTTLDGFTLPELAVLNLYRKRAV